MTPLAPCHPFNPLLPCAGSSHHVSFKQPHFPRCLVAHHLSTSAYPEHHSDLPYRSTLTPSPSSFAVPSSFPPCYHALVRLTAYPLSNPLFLSLVVVAHPCQPPAYPEHHSDLPYRSVLTPSPSFFPVPSSPPWWPRVGSSHRVSFKQSPFPRRLVLHHLSTSSVPSRAPLKSSSIDRRRPPRPSPPLPSSAATCWSVPLRTLRTSSSPPSLVTSLPTTCQYLRRNTYWSSTISTGRHSSGCWGKLKQSSTSRLRAPTR